jgi:hypothetical protein
MESESRSGGAEVQTESSSRATVRARSEQDPPRLVFEHTKVFIFDIYAFSGPDGVVIAWLTSRPSGSY